MSVEHCFINKDINPKTCRIVNKCKKGFQRNENFRCRKISNKTNNKYSLKKIVNELKKIDTPTLNVSNTTPLDNGSPNFKDKMLHINSPTLNVSNTTPLNNGSLRFSKTKKINSSSNKTIKFRNKLKQLNSPELNVSNSTPLNNGSPNFKDKIAKLNTPKLDFSEESPLYNEKDMKKSIATKMNIDEPTKSIHVFPDKFIEINEKDKKYIEFKNGGTGIMLADNLYKDGKILSFSKKNSYMSPPNGWYISEKYDGLRGIWTGKNIVSRPSKIDGVLRGKIFNYVPEWFLGLLPKNIALDGEIWLGRGMFQKISGISNYKISKKITKEYLDNIWKDVKFMIFDVPHINKPYVERLKILKKIISDINIKNPQQTSIHFNEPLKISNLEELSKIYSEYIENGAEGVILREPNSFYECKRSKFLLKMKLNNDDEAIVLKYIKGTKRLEGLLGSLLCKLKNGKTFSIGSGFSDIMRKEYNDPDSQYYIPIGSKINFSYMELTKDNIPRHPIYRGIRTDV